MDFENKVDTSLQMLSQRSITLSLILLWRRVFESRVEHSLRQTFDLCWKAKISQQISPVHYFDKVSRCIVSLVVACG